ncbi:uncharacterized protein LOC123698227 [Colias croceus]|uniref:uncharacterized protein LOC123698227 n=1 Tax=Colias crocea TaxID=72248 RepID=UPI001E27E7EF|nr:uncharacterized protein LOC123698227 [Colias croceus]
MTSRIKIEKWLLADWSTDRGGNSGMKVSDDMKNLSISTDRKESGKETEPKDNRPQIKRPRGSAASNGNNDSGAGGSLPNEDLDFSESASSWAPTGESSSSSSDESNRTEKENNSKTNEMAQYVRQLVKIRHSKKVLTPVHRPNAVVNILQERQMNGNHPNKGRKRKYKEIKDEVNKSLPDSTRKNMFTRPNVLNGTVNVKLRNIIEINATFQQLFTMLNALRPPQQANTTFLNEESEVIEKTYDEPEESDRSESEESNRSDDNVLISNKYIKARSNSGSPRGQENSKEEWIPIGSGKTLIHKDKYRKVNWKSYTIATRTLLLATFPRRILATHSLTGKRSPAFQNKPAKMCLDPKIVSDVIIEITSRFKVKENLVRSIITTKCADECKMYKMRLKTKGRPKDKLSHESSTDQENVPKNDSLTVK